MPLVNWGAHISSAVVIKESWISHISLLSNAMESRQRYAAFIADNNNIVTRVRARTRIPRLCVRVVEEERRNAANSKARTVYPVNGRWSRSTTSTQIPVFPWLLRPHWGHRDWRTIDATIFIIETITEWFNRNSINASKHFEIKTIARSLPFLFAITSMLFLLRQISFLDEGQWR